MNYKTLLKNSLWVGGGMFLGSIVNAQIVQPNISNLDINPTLKALVGPAVMVGAGFLAQDLLPRKVVYGAIGLAGYNVIGQFAGGMMPGNSPEQEQQA